MKWIEQATGYHHLQSAKFLDKEIVILTICDLILSFPDLLLGTESISYLGPVILDILPNSYKILPNFSVFKNRIKEKKPDNFPFRHCKTYTSRVGLTQASAPVRCMFIAFQFLLQAVDVNSDVYIVIYIQLFFNLHSFMYLMFVKF